MDQGFVCNHSIQEVTAICLEEQCQHNYCVNCETKSHPHEQIYKFNQESIRGQITNYSNLQGMINIKIEEIKLSLDDYLRNIELTLSTLDKIQTQLNNLCTIDLLLQIKHFALNQNHELIRQQEEDIKNYLDKIKKYYFNDLSSIKENYCEDSDDELNIGSQQNQASHGYDIYNNFSNNQITSGTDQQVSVDLEIESQQTKIS